MSRGNVLSGYIYIGLNLSPVWTSVCFLLLLFLLFSFQYMSASVHAERDFTRQKIFSQDGVNYDRTM